MRFLVPMISALALVACTQEAPDSGSGVGFQSYPEYLRQQAARDAALRGQAQPGAAQTQDPVLTPQERQQILGADAGAAPTGAPATPAAPVNNAGISDEQNFDAVSNRETIASDRQRIEQNRQQYQVIQPTALPQRTGSGGPNIVEYALSTTNTVGQSQYSRSMLLAESRFNRNCAKYGSSDLAQEDFLRSGGPQRDRKGLDPDGDGFACYWDPAPFRAARRARN
ncbi:hypothetical protein [Aliiroseovarius sp. YM-037]|uniref:hypothetical protein n=1 Tax=Aliiroseovarius sp. YM-037 TaxID=3341728 RepID=UPI003A7FB8ED